jgi:ATP-dependent Lon protease
MTVAQDELDELIVRCFPDVSVHKGVASRIGGGERAIPAFVRDWLVSRYSADGKPNRSRIQAFLQDHLPDKQQRELLKNRLLGGERLTILDGYEVSVDLNRGERRLRIPSLDIFDARVNTGVVDRNPLLLSGPVWGAGRLEYQLSDRGGEVWMVEFQPMQTAIVDLDYYIAQRREFSVEQWRGLLLRSMGYEPSQYTPQQASWLISRLALLVQPRTNLIELAPKSTGKSYVFSQLSKYGWLISGGIVTRAKLFYDMAARAPGVITKYDAVVLDEVQTIRLQEEGEILGAMKGFLEYGEFRVMGFSGNSEASFALLANIPIGSDGRPARSSGRSGCILETLPSWLNGKDATALLDRFHGLIPGWELPRVQKRFFADGLGLRADYLSEVLHALRRRDEYTDFVLQYTRGDGDKRDITAVQRLCAALLRIYFPDLAVSRAEFEHYCLGPAKTMRAMVREQMAIMDPEYSPQLAPVECTL